MKYDEKAWTFTPKVVAHCTGQRFPKDINHRSQRLLAKFTLCMPDGFLVSVPIFEGEETKKKLNSYIEHWYEVTNKDPEKFDHFDIKDLCPKCGGSMRCRIVNNCAMIWCIDPKCGFKDIEEGPKVRERVYEKHKLKTTYTSKEGTKVILSNKSNKNK